VNYDIHGRIGIHVADDSPGAAQLADMFASVATDAHVPGNLQVARDHPSLDAPSSVEDELLYTDQTVIDRQQDVGVTRTDLGYLITGRGELLTAVVPLLDHLMTLQDTAMIHAATVAIDGIGVALPASGGTGKTSSVAKLMRQPRIAFMGDDWAFLDHSGELLGFQKPMFIKAHHREIYPQLFEGSRKPLIPRSLARPVGRMTTVVHPHIVKYPRAAAAARRWSPEHRQVHFRSAFPDAPVSTSAPLGLVVYVERFAGGASRLEGRSPEWMADRIIGNFHFELAGPSRALLDSLTATGMVPLDRYLGRKREIITSAIRGCPTYLLRIPVTYTADQASDDLVRQLQTLTGDLRPPPVGVGAVAGDRFGA
jgi:hypothetical protein